MAEFEYQAIRIVKDDDGVKLYRRTPKNEYLVEVLPPEAVGKLLDALGVEPDVRVLYDGAAGQVRVFVDHVLVALVPVSRGTTIQVGKQGINTGDLPMADAQRVG